VSFVLALRRALPALRLSGLTALCLALMTGAGEGVLRLRAVQAALPSPDIGSSYEEGAKQMRLEWLQADGPVDCFFVGSSVVVQGIDPAIVQDDLARAGGPSMSCFNAAIRGGNMPGIEQKIARLSLYHPRLIVYGVTYRDLIGGPIPKGPILFDVIPDFDTATEPGVADTPLSLADWLNGNSYLYRYYSTFRWYMSATAPALDSRAQYEAGLDQRGFLHVLSAWPYIDRTPYPRTKFSTNGAMLSSMARAVGPHGEKTTIVVVEMPIPPTSTHLLAGADKTYDKYVEAVQQVASAEQVPFIRTTRLNLIPENGWADPIHLNETGARVFSHWLAMTLVGVLTR
jgi:hypothetical protein